MSKNEIVLRAEGLMKHYAEEKSVLRVVDGLDLAVRRGETVAILGSSGSGKSTLLHLLGGLDTADSGSVTVDGVRLDALSDDARGRLRNDKLGFVYQFHHLLPEFTALDNVAMPLWIRREGRTQAAERAAALLRSVGLGERLEHLPSRLSGGERQRVAIARAVVTRPACILADEPTGNLDTDTATRVFDLFLTLAHEEGTALVVVTHDTMLASRCDRVLRLVNGRLAPA